MDDYEFRIHLRKSGEDDVFEQQEKRWEKIVNERQAVVAAYVLLAQERRELQRERRKLSREREAIRREWDAVREALDAGPKKKRRANKQTGTTKGYYRFLNSGAWAKKREQKLDSAGRLCACCGNKEQLHVHHLHYRSPWGQERMSDLQVLCLGCHGKEHR